MFSDPLVLTRLFTTITPDAAGDLSLAASERSSDHSSYRATDADLNDHLVKISHQYAKRWRFSMRYDLTGLVPSSLVPAEKQKFSQSCYVVFDCPNFGAIESTATLSNLATRQMMGVGSFLIAQGAGIPLLQRVVKNGET